MVWPFSSSESNQNQKEPSSSIFRDENGSTEGSAAASTYSGEIPRRKLVDAVNENCALENFALLECQDSWAFWKRFTLCQAFQTRYMDCMNAQRVSLVSNILTPQTLLLQLGYGKRGNAPEQDELIKWHADELYQQQLRDREKKKLGSKKE